MRPFDLDSGPAAGDVELHGLARRPGDALDNRIRGQGDSFVLKELAHRRRHVFVFPVDQGRVPFDDGHFRPQPAKSLGQL